jgi:Sugar (and other) transporter
MGFQQERLFKVSGLFQLIVAGSGKWISLAGILLYLVFFSISLGPIPWTVNSEIYPLHLRGVGNSLATTVNWISNFAVSQVFLLVTATSTGQVITFVSIAICCVGTWIFVHRLLPETKGRMIESIVAELCPDA